MTETNTKELRALKSQVQTGVLKIVGVFGAVGSLLFLVAVYFATGLTPKAMNQNYHSIEAAMQMREAWSALRHSNEHPGKTPDEWKADFQKALAFEQSNITEIGEHEKAEEIQKLWLSSVNEVSALPDTSFQLMNTHLDQLVELNRQGMLRIVKDAEDLRTFTLTAALIFFFMTLFITLVRAARFASDLTTPISDLTAALKKSDTEGKNQVWPRSHWQEIQTLIDSVEASWRRRNS